jgi:hypothetical protein
MGPPSGLDPGVDADPGGAVEQSFAELLADRLLGLGLLGGLLPCPFQIPRC